MGDPIEGLQFRSVDRSNWSDLETLFESKGGPHPCWCMLWRKKGDNASAETKAGKKQALKSYVENKIPIGIIAYSENHPIGWCSIAPRESYKSLSGDDTLSGVWSLACLFIAKNHRKTGLKLKLIAKAIEYARESKASFVEAYPVLPDSPSYRFMGLVQDFEKLGFRKVKMAGKRRHVMIQKL